MRTPTLRTAPLSEGVRIRLHLKKVVDTLRQREHMDMTEMLLRFFEFDRWANQETLRSLETMTNPPERAVALIAHIAATQRVWLERALSLPQSVAVWPQWSLSETAKELSGVLGEWTRLIATDDLSREFAYTNTKGQEFWNRLSDVALHVAFHGVYHRGQIAALVRQHGGEPAYTDFIQAVRTGAVSPSSSNTEFP